MRTSPKPTEMAANSPIFLLDVNYLHDTNRNETRSCVRLRRLLIVNYSRDIRLSIIYMLLDLLRSVRRYNNNNDN